MRVENFIQMANSVSHPDFWTAKTIRESFPRWAEMWRTGQVIL